MKTEVSQQRGEKVLRVLIFTLIISAMSALMFNIVIPAISKEFQLTVSQASWLSSAYVLIYAIGTVIYGKLADRYQLKDLLTFGLFMFAIGSLVGLVSQTFWMALFGRCLQAVGASAIPAAAMLIPVRYFSPERRGSALGMVSVGLAIGAALGPALSALIVSIAHWRWLFAVPILVLFTVPFYRKYLQDEQKQMSGDFDWIGGGLLAVTVTLLLLAITVGTVWFILGGLLTLILFIVRIRSVDAPFVQPMLFKNKKYTFGLVIGFIINGVAFALYFVSPLLLAQVQQLSSSWIGFIMVPAAIASALLGRKGGKLVDMRGNTYLFFIASGLLLICFTLLSTFTGSASVFIAIFLIFGNVGQSFMIIVLSNSISRQLPKEQIGVGMGMFAMLNFIAGSIATGVYSKVVDIGSNFHWSPISISANGFVFSNLYFVLAVLLVAVMLFYYFQFARSEKQEKVQLNS